MVHLLWVLLACPGADDAPDVPDLADDTERSAPDDTAEPADDTAPPEGQPWSADRSAEVDRAALAELERQSLVGLAVGAVVDGEVVYTAGYGEADRATGAPVTTETLFRWASISKPLTAVATMQLAHEGALGLGDGAGDHVAGWPDKPEGPVTVQDLMCHQGGIVHYSHFDWETALEASYPHRDDSSFDHDAAVGVFADQPLLDAPGADYSYSSFGYTLLGVAAGEAAGLAFPELIDDRVATPLGLDSLQPDYQWVDLPERAVGYTTDSLGQIVESTNTDVSWKLPGGGFLSNIDDLTGFVAGVARGDLVDPGSEATMWTEQATDAGEWTGMGLGFSLYGAGDQDLGTRWVYHSGSQEKTRTLFILMPDRGFGVAAMSNSEWANMFDVVYEVMSAWLPWRYAGVWLPNTGPQELTRDADASALDDRDGWALTDLETWVDERGSRRWEGVWTEGEGTSRRDLSRDELDAAVTELAADGWALEDVETYLDVETGARRWAAAWVAGGAARELRVDLTGEELLAAQGELSAAGMDLIDVEIWSDASEPEDAEPRWVGIWATGDGGGIWFRELSGDAFTAAWSSTSDQGYRLVDVETYLGADGERLWTGLFLPGSGYYGLYTGTGAQFLHQTWADWSADYGMGLADLERY